MVANCVLIYETGGSGLPSCSATKFGIYVDLEPGSSVSIVSDYGLDDRAIGVRSPAGEKDSSSSLCVQTGSGPHLASCSMGTGVLYQGVKCGRGVTLTTDLHVVTRSRMNRSYTSSPLKRLHGVYWGCFAFVERSVLLLYC
jgi:hypothetical protein